ncbi:MAG TPA: hypothetical protein DC024_07035, partial [Clostridiales bacterium]|nr:hypothetical protein [Clostridiales bacterium]
MKINDLLSSHFVLCLFKNYFSKNKQIFIVILAALMAPTDINAGNYTDNKKVDCKDTLQKVFSPVIISRAPTNEATLVSVNDKLKKIFF